MKKILQGFKQLFKRKNKTIYICDPARNHECNKLGCWDISKGPCKCTAKRKYAKRTSGGDRIIANDEDLYNEEWLDYCIAQRLAAERKQI